MHSEYRHQSIFVFELYEQTIINSKLLLVFGVDLDIETVGSLVDASIEESSISTCNNTGSFGFVSSGRDSRAGIWGCNPSRLHHLPSHRTILDCVAWWAPYPASRRESMSIRPWWRRHSWEGCLVWFGRRLRRCQAGWTCSDTQTNTLSWWSRAYVMILYCPSEPWTTLTPEMVFWLTWSCCTMLASLCDVDACT